MTRAETNQTAFSSVCGRNTGTGINQPGSSRGCERSVLADGSAHLLWLHSHHSPSRRLAIRNSAMLTCERLHSGVRSPPGSSPGFAAITPGALDAGWPPCSLARLALFRLDFYSRGFTPPSQLPSAKCHRSWFAAKLSFYITDINPRWQKGATAPYKSSGRMTRKWDKAAQRPAGEMNLGCLLNQCLPSICVFVCVHVCVSLVVMFLPSEANLFCHFWALQIKLNWIESWIEFFGLLGLFFFLAGRGRYLWADIKLTGRWGIHTLLSLVGWFKSDSLTSQSGDIACSCLSLPLIFSDRVRLLWMRFCSHAKGSAPSTSQPVKFVHFLIFLQHMETAEVETARVVPLPLSGGMCYLK